MFTYPYYTNSVKSFTALSLTHSPLHSGAANKETFLSTLPVQCSQSVYMKTKCSPACSTSHTSFICSCPNVHNAEPEAANVSCHSEFTLGYNL